PHTTGAVRDLHRPHSGGDAAGRAGRGVRPRGRAGQARAHLVLRRVPRPEHGGDRGAAAVDRPAARRGDPGGERRAVPVVLPVAGAGAGGGGGRVRVPGVRVRVAAVRAAGGRVRLPGGVVREPGVRRA